jgi:eukaryotic-like serine/threonine-protein kinase
MRELRELPSLLDDRYLLVEQVARGGMATVYRAEDRQGGREVAIKVLRPELSVILGPTRFHREIHILSRLQHPNVLPLLDSREAGGTLYYVTPFVRGASLRQRLERDGAFPLDQALGIAADIALALDYAHAQNVIHRDIKPANILLDGAHAVLCDFGVARAIVRSATEPLSSSGLIIGTAAYMSPEQAMGSHDVGPASDLYSFGCVVYEMLTGERPFTGATAQAVLARQLSERPPSPRFSRPDLPVHMETALLKALAKSPTMRPGTAGELVSGLRGSAS